MFIVLQDVLSKDDRANRYACDFSKLLARRPFKIIGQANGRTEIG